MAGITNKSEVARIFETMEYGPAPESDGPAQKWLEARGYLFFSYIFSSFKIPRINLNGVD